MTPTIPKIRPGKRNISIAVLALVLLTSCDLEFPEQEIYFQHDEKADRLDVLLVYRGVTASSDSPGNVKKGVAAAKRFLAGRREFMILDWPFYWDLDAEDKDVPKWLRQHVSLVRMGTFTDEHERLCAWQHLRLERVSDGFRLLNQAIVKGILEAHKKGRLEKELSGFGPEAATTYLDQAVAGRPFMRLEKGRLLVEVPAPRLGALRFLEKEMQKKDGWWLGNLLAQMRHPKIMKTGGVVVQLGDFDGGVTRFRLARPDVTYSSALQDALVAQGLISH